MLGCKCATIKPCIALVVCDDSRVIIIKFRALHYLNCSTTSTSTTDANSEIHVKKALHIMCMCVPILHTHTHTCTRACQPIVKP